MFRNSAMDVMSVGTPWASYINQYDLILIVTAKHDSKGTVTPGMRIRSHLMEIARLTRLLTTVIQETPQKTHTRKL